MARAVIGVFLLASLSALAHAQEDVTVRTVRGTVTDGAGRPVQGATVRLHIEPHAQRRLLAQRLLTREPLPWTKTGGDGTYTLALLPSHQHLSELELGRAGLIVEKTGYQSWREPVPGPLPLYAGSDVQLRALGEQAEATVRIAEPALGMRLRVQRFDNYAAGSSSGELPSAERWFDVPDSGIVRVPVPLLPNPAVLPLGSDFAVLRHDVEVVWPTGRSAPRVLVPGGEVRLKPIAAEAPRQETMARDARLAAGAPDFGKVRIRVTDDTDRPIKGALPALWLTLPPKNDLLSWIPPDAARWFTDRDGAVDWDGVPTGQATPSASRPGWVSLGWGPAQRVRRDGTVEMTLQMTRVVDHEVSVRDAAGELVPFAALKQERWTDHADGTSSAGLSYLRADSRGVARARRPAGEALELQQVDPGKHRARGVRVPEGHSELVVHRHARVLLRTTPGEILLSHSVPGARHATGRPTELGNALLWRGLATVAFAVRGAPPVVWVAPSDPAQHGGSDLLDIDRSRVVRRVPLALSGVGDSDLVGLRAVPIAVAGHRYMRPLESDMAARDGAGGWSLASRDPYAHECLLMHPAFLCRRIALPAADAPNSDRPIGAELVRGTPVELRFSVGQKLHDLDALHLWVAHASIPARLDNGGPIYSARLAVPDDQLAATAFALPLPFALEPGEYEVSVQGLQGSAKHKIDIPDASPTVLDLGVLSR